jgi:hypothetical protein
MTTTTENQRSLTTPWIIMAAISGVLIGSSVVRMGACDADDALSLDAARVVQLEADLRVRDAADEHKRLAEQKWVDRPWCQEPPSHYACAIDWRFILAGSPGWLFIDKDRYWWLVRWERYHAEIPTP